MDGGRRGLRARRNRLRWWLRVRVGTTAAETTSAATRPEVEGEPPTAETDSPYAFGTYEVEGDRITLAGACATVWQAGQDEVELEVVVDVAGCDLPSGSG